MDEKLILEVKKKREFSQLPDSLVSKALELKNCGVKETRAFLRKYFGVFLTNKVLKGKDLDILERHLSSKKRDYEKFYEEIFNCVNDHLKSKTFSITDLGCGANGFSYSYILEKLNFEPDYLGVEAVGQIVNNTHEFFIEKKYTSAKIIHGNLLDIYFVDNILKKRKCPKVVFLFQVVDAFENFEKNFSKVFISKVMDSCELMIITLPLESLGGRKKFHVIRKWLVEFLSENFIIKKDFKMNGERIIIISNKTND